jgi:hypothetical protein
VRGLGVVKVDGGIGDGVGVAWGDGMVGFNVDLGIPGLFSCCGGWRFVGGMMGYIFLRRVLDRHI